uniref:Uncharacterized protein n=1 Tax=Anguilla anguilla TaxID=7936 RepID=A0A0E9RYB2_ANGAN
MRLRYPFTLHLIILGTIILELSMSKRKKTECPNKPPHAVK